MSEPAPDAERGRKLVAASLVALFLLNAWIAQIGGSTSALMAYWRPLLIGLLCLLVWQGRTIARLPLIAFSLGAILAGPLATANGIPPLSVAGVVFWLCTIVAAVSAYILLRSRDATFFLISQSVKR